MKQITETVYVETGYRLPNVSCILTEEGAVLVDSPFLPSEAKDWRNKIDKLTDKGIAYIVNTDWHFDHMLGNCFLGNRVIAHNRSLKGFLHYKKKGNLLADIKMFFPKEYPLWENELKAVDVNLPQITFQMSLIYAWVAKWFSLNGWVGIIRELFGYIIPRKKCFSLVIISKIKDIRICGEPGLMLC